MLPCGTCAELLSDCVISHLTSKPSCPVIWKPTVHGHPKSFSTIPLLKFLALAFTVVNSLLLCNLNFTSVTPLSCVSFGYQTDMQIFYVTPALSFWFIVVSSVIQLFPFLDMLSPIPPIPTKFHHHLNAWIHTMPVTPGSTLSPCLGGTTHHGFHPKWPLKCHQNDHWMTCHPPWLP